jgi:beta-galactosidase
VQGGELRADVALVWDWEARWGLELEFRPSVEVDFLERFRAFYSAFWHAGVTVDIVAPGDDLSAYRLVAVPSLYLMGGAAANALSAYAEGDGTLVVSFFSGIVDEHDRVPDGPYPAGLRDVLGLTIEEFHPLAGGARVAVEGGLSGDVWSERVVPRGATVERRFTDGPDAGEPAVTRHGSAWYVATRMDRERLWKLLAPICAGTGVTPAVDAPAGVEALRRGDHLFLLNHVDAEVRVAASGHDLLEGTDHDGEVVLPPGGVRVLSAVPPIIRG